MRLVQGDNGISNARSESGAKPNSGRLPDGRLARYPNLSRICSQGRRGGTADAGRGCCQGVVRAAIEDLCGQKRATARGVWPFSPIRRIRGESSPDRTAQRGDAQRPQRVEAHRTVYPAPRYSREGERRPDLRHRSQAAGHVERRHSRLPGIRRQASLIRCGEDRIDARYPSRGACWRLSRRRDCRSLVAGERGAQRSSHRLGRRP